MYGGQSLPVLKPVLRFGTFDYCEAAVRRRFLQHSKALLGVTLTQIPSEQATRPPVIIQVLSLV
jgi:hypothetical protein